LDRRKRCKHRDVVLSLVLEELALDEDERRVFGSLVRKNLYAGRLSSVGE
jgi:hypothetical protein